MSRKHRTYSPSFKAQIALMALTQNRPTIELAEQFAVHPDQVESWKRQLINNADSSFQPSSTHKNYRHTVDALTSMHPGRSVSFGERCVIALGGVVGVLLTNIAFISYTPLEGLAGIDPDGTIMLAISIVIVAALFTFKQSWRPGISQIIVWTLAGFAWFGAAIVDYSTKQNVASTVAAGFALLILGLAYVLWFRPIGQDENQYRSEQWFREILREEMTNAPWTTNHTDSNGTNEQQ